MYYTLLKIYINIYIYFIFLFFYFTLCAIFFNLIGLLRLDTGDWFLSCQLRHSSSMMPQKSDILIWISIALRSEHLTHVLWFSNCIIGCQTIFILTAKLESHVSHSFSHMAGLFFVGYHILKFETIDIWLGLWRKQCSAVPISFLYIATKPKRIKMELPAKILWDSKSWRA